MKTNFFSISSDTSGIPRNISIMSIFSSSPLDASNDGKMEQTATVSKNIFEMNIFDRINSRAKSLRRRVRFDSEQRARLSTSLYYATHTWFERCLLNFTSAFRIKKHLDTDVALT